MLYYPTSRLFLLGCLGFLLAGSAPVFAQSEKEVYVAKVDQDGVQRVRIVGGGYFFKPNHIIVKVNVPVELVASKEAGIVPHNIAIKAPEAGVAVEEDLDTEPKKIAFTATAVGKYPLYCSNKLLFFASHRERGMEGILEVVP
jgi:plastocyanin